MDIKTYNNSDPVQLAMLMDRMRILLNQLNAEILCHQAIEFQGTNHRLLQIAYENIERVRINLHPIQQNQIEHIIDLYNNGEFNKQPVSIEEVHKAMDKLDRTTTGFLATKEQWAQAAEEALKIRLYALHQLNDQ